MSATHGTRHITILITEDDDGHAELIRELLAEVGVLNPILRFRDGQELVDFLSGTGSQQAPRGTEGFLLLLDIRMPRLNGLETLRIIKGNETWRTIPTIMLTTTDDPHEIRQCYDAGCNFYITKPIEFERFTEVLRNIGLFLLIVQVPKTPA